MHTGIGAPRPEHKYMGIQACILIYECLSLHKHIGAHRLTYGYRSMWACIQVYEHPVLHAPLLAPPISCIFNSSIREGLASVPKVSPPTMIEKHLRPISLSPVISKQLEYFIYNWLLDYVKPHLDPLQFGALRGSSCTHALISMLHECYRDTDDSS